MLNVGVLRYNSGDLVGAAKCWRRGGAACKGNACRYYARCLTRGEGIPADSAARDEVAQALPRATPRRRPTRSTSPASALTSTSLPPRRRATPAPAWTPGEDVIHRRGAEAPAARGSQRGARRRRAAPSGACSWGAPGLVPDPRPRRISSRGPGPPRRKRSLAALYGRVPRPLADPTPAPAREGRMACSGKFCHYLQKTFDNSPKRPSHSAFDAEVYTRPHGERLLEMCFAAQFLEPEVPEVAGQLLGRGAVFDARRARAAAQHFRQARRASRRQHH